jgi:hypothetical protein
MAHPKNPFSLDALIKSASANDYFFISLTEAQLEFLARQNLVTAKKIHEKLEPKTGDNFDEWGLKLQKYNDLTVLEAEGIRKVKFDYALRIELLADIGDYKTCSEKEAINILSSAEEWEQLPPELQGRIKDWYFDVTADDNLSTFTARQITVIIQSRLLPDWELQDTLSLSKSIFSAFQEFLEGEQSGWAKEEEEPLALSDDAGKDGHQPLGNTPKQLEKVPTGKR